MFDDFAQASRSRSNSISVLKQNIVRKKINPTWRSLARGKIDDLAVSSKINCLPRAIETL